MKHLEGVDHLFEPRPLHILVEKLSPLIVGIARCKLLRNSDLTQKFPPAILDCVNLFSELFVSTRIVLMKSRP